MNKEREAFEAWFESRYGAHFMQFALDLDFYADKHTQTCWEAWQAAKAQSVLELTDKMIVAIESEVESQLKASAIDADPFRLDGEKIWYAALEAQEPK